MQLVDEEMDGVAHEQRVKLETIEAELAEVRRRMDRLWHAVETSDLEINDILPRLKQHKERQERLETAAYDARRTLSERRAVLDSVEAIAAFAEEMSEFLQTSELTESRAFICTFVKEIAVKPGTATIRYTIPMPPDSPVGAADSAEVALSDPVMSTVRSGCRAGIRTPTKGSKGPCATVTPLGSGVVVWSGAEGRTRTGTGFTPNGV